MPGKPPYFPFYPNDFAADGKVEAMSTMEVGAYILLLCKAWMEEPPGSLPADDQVLARWARMDSDRWAEAKRAVLSAFTAGDDGRLYQKRMVLEFQKFRSISKARRSAAKASWQKRRSGKDGDDAIAEHLHSKSYANGLHASGSEYGSEFGSEKKSQPSEQGGSGGAEKSAPQKTPPCEDAAGLAQRWCFLYRGTVSAEKNPYTIADVFGEWLSSLGLGVEPLRLEIERKGRDKTEPTWEMKKRLNASRQGRSGERNEPSKRFRG